MAYLGDVIHAAIETDIEAHHEVRHQADLEALANYEAERTQQDNKLVANEVEEMTFPSDGVGYNVYAALMAKRAANS
jgi:hypothetical protein